MRELVRAAGGLVWRRSTQGALEVVLVHRPAYDDWTFPKGKLEPGEDETAAARREVEEETGLRCTLGSELGITTYLDSKSRRKTVRYWEMRPAGGALAPAHEIDDARWVAVADAADELSYDRDRELLARLIAVLDS